MPLFERRMFTLQNMFAVLMILQGLVIEVSPTKGLVGFLAETYGFHAELYGFVFALCGGIALNKNLLPSQFGLTLTPFVFHMVATVYYSVFVSTDTSLGPALWLFFIVSIGVVSIFKGTYNDLYSSDRKEGE